MSRIEKLIAEKEFFDEKLLTLGKFMYSDNLEYTEEYLELDSQERWYLKEEYLLLCKLSKYKQERIDYLKNK